jgi:hypothetical protein
MLGYAVGFSDLTKTQTTVNAGYFWSRDRNKSLGIKTCGDKLI